MVPDGQRSIHRVIGGGSSFGNNPLTTTIGLGRAGAIDDVEIAWPDGGTRQVTRGLPLDRAVEITEGREGFRLAPADAGVSVRAARVQVLFPPLRRGVHRQAFFCGTRPGSPDPA